MDNIIITENGQRLLTRINAGETMAVFTKIGTSDAIYEESELHRLSMLKNMRQQTEVLHVDIKENSTVVISGYVDNREVEAGYYITLLGIFAKAQNEEEILYGVTMVSHSPYLPGASETLTGISLRFTMKIENSENIFVDIDETTALTIGEFHAYERDFNERFLRLEFPAFEDYVSTEYELQKTEEIISKILSKEPVTHLFQYIKVSLMGLYVDRVKLSQKLQDYSPFVTMFHNLPISERAEDKWYLMVKKERSVLFNYCQAYIFMSEDIPISERKEMTLYGKEIDIKSDLAKSEIPEIMRLLEFVVLESREMSEDSVREQDCFYFYEMEERKVWQE